MYLSLILKTRKTHISFTEHLRICIEYNFVFCDFNPHLESIQNVTEDGTRNHPDFNKKESINSQNIAVVLNFITFWSIPT